MDDFDTDTPEAGASVDIQAAVEQAEPDVLEYDRYVVAFSGGKDGLASLLHLLECGVDRNKIELHHHLVDGREGSSLYDWPITESYSEAIAKALGVSLTFSHRVGGLEREMLRENSATAPVCIPFGDGYKVIGGDGPLGTRRKFPQVSANLSVRWCSAVAKIDCFARYMTNNPKFREGKTLVLTGERAEESKSRANYKRFEPHRSDLRNGRDYQRHIDAWRPVHAWSEQQVWDIIKRWQITSHPAYSFAEVSIWAAKSWKFVHRLPAANMGTPPGLRAEYDGHAAKFSDSDFQRDRDELIKIAERICFPEFHRQR